ncbi:PREDICTED: uncharacterized protein LOC106297287 isoform X2 [Brassica oleracea var. oleracea]|uniref:uncharacterized protein LOC106297287 isoform X2 n=1 Tax=Brassica oleracea var. oleracea TaxID=109376 RepID=UPI0006A6DE8A|nr:PREDICTED: uncharacterized protein LOC106297287 isoform X2 [Brassica oleracea var. oleracea]
MMDTFFCNTYEQNHAPFDHQDDVVDIYDHDHHHAGDHEEESGWTTYLDDFSNQYRTHCEDSDHQDKSSCSLLGVSSSLISDAATDAFSGRNFPVNFPAKLKFGKARTKMICEDDSLEDTASSPVNSPKRTTRGMVDNQIQIQEGYEQSTTMTTNLGEGNINSNNNNMDLRNRGLCVVPISMLANFNGRF